MVEIRTSSEDAQTQEIVKLQIADKDLDFEQASHLARTRARALNKDAMMLAWFNRRSGEGFPDYDCGASDRPPWRVFAEARGANLTVDVNDGEYIFLYLKF
jgi:hypothetical protein